MISVPLQIAVTVQNFQANKSLETKEALNMKQDSTACFIKTIKAKL
jgi:hypothetical protein